GPGPAIRGGAAARPGQRHGGEARDRNPDRLLHSCSFPSSGRMLGEAFAPSQGTPFTRCVFRRQCSHACDRVPHPAGGRMHVSLRSAVFLSLTVSVAMGACGGNVVVDQPQAGSGGATTSTGDTGAVMTTAPATTTTTVGTGGVTTVSVSTGTTVVSSS